MAKATCSSPSPSPAGWNYVAPGNVITDTQPFTYTQTQFINFAILPQAPVQPVCSYGKIMSPTRVYVKLSRPLPAGAITCASQQQINGTSGYAVISCH